MVIVLAVFYLRRSMSSNVLPQLLYHFLKQDVQVNPGSYRITRVALRGRRRMGRCLMVVSLLVLSAVSAFAQPVPEYFKLRSSTAQSMAELQGICQPVADTIASFATELGGTNVSAMPGHVRITFPKDKRFIELSTQPKQTHCTAYLTCQNPEGGGAEALCQQIERLVQDLQRKSQSQR